MSSIHVLTGALLLSFLCEPARSQSIACQKLRLDNGMTVILHRDARLPIVAVNLWYRVGARDEPPGRSGFAHLFEHLMFMGTERVPGNEFDALMEAGGGSNNATTNEDRTDYFSQGPAALLPTLLWLEADRLEDLGRAMTREKLDRQRDIVRNEIRETVENRPYGRADERVFQLMYPAGHPYHEGVLGRHRDLEAATVADVKDFFASFYVPSNVSLVIAGDFDPAAVEPLVRELFGSLPRGAPPGRRAPPPAELDGVVRTTMLDRVQLPRIKMAWHGPARFAAGDAELVLLGEVLSSGRQSRLYRRLVVEDRLAVDVAAYQDAFGLGSLFQIDVTAASGADLDRVERAIDEELAKVREAGVTDAELEERKSAHELRQLASLQSIAAVADQLNQYEAVWGEPDSFARDLERFRRVTPAGVQAEAQRVLRPDGRAIIRVLPEEPPRAPSARDARAGPAVRDGAFDPPAPERFTLENGIPVSFWRVPELPLVAVQLMAATGTVLTEPARAGLPVLLCAMLEEGAGELDAAEFAAEMERLGAWFSTGATHEAATVSLLVLKRNFGPALGLAADAVRRPRLAEADWARVKALHLDGLRRQDDDPDAVASRIGMRLLFGAGNPYGWSASGMPVTVEPLSVDDVRRAHAALFEPGKVALFAAGDITAQELRAALGRAFGDWRGSAARRGPAADLSAPRGSGLRVAVVDRPGAVQTVIRFIAPAPAYRDPRRVRCEVLDSILGGGFTSRLNQTLREAHGYTYGAGAAYSMSAFAGSFMAWASVRTDATGAALKDFFAEFARLSAEAGGDVTEAEVEKARASLRTAVIRTFANLTGVLDTARGLALNDLPFDTVGADLAAIDALTARELNAFAKASLPIDEGVLVLVGDARAILEQIAGLGLPESVRLDVHGREVPR